MGIFAAVAVELPIFDGHKSSPWSVLAICSHGMPSVGWNSPGRWPARRERLEGVRRRAGEVASYLGRSTESLDKAREGAVC